MSNKDSGWFKSSYSGAANDTCVEVRLTEGATGLRDSKNPDGGALRVGATAWASLLAGVRVSRGCVSGGVSGSMS